MHSENLAGFVMIVVSMYGTGPPSALVAGATCSPRTTLDRDAQPDIVTAMAKMNEDNRIGLLAIVFIVAAVVVCLLVMVLGK